MIMLILLTCSSMVMADDEETIYITAESVPANLGEKYTTLSENISQYFTWIVPSQLSISDNTDFTIKVTEAHLNSDSRLKISVSGIDENGIIQLHDSTNSEIKGSKVTLKNEYGTINNNSFILVVDSSSFDEGADISERTANITMSAKRNPFQLAGNYLNNITFKASISQ